MLSNSHDTKKERLKDSLLGLHWAATTGNVGLVKFALDHGVPINSVVNGFVPLQLACISDNNLAVIQYLIDRGADVNIQKWSKKYSENKSQAVSGATGSTALHVACANGCTKVVDLLLRNNARVDVKDKYGTSPLDIALAKHETEIVRLLKTAREKQRHKNQRRPRAFSSSSNEDNSDVMAKSMHGRKSVDGTLHQTISTSHKRSISDKQPRIRRPSLPSIFEGHQRHFTPQQSSILPSSMTMTPTTKNSSQSHSATETIPVAVSRRSFSSTHRPSLDEPTFSSSYHSCPTTPRTSIDHYMHTKRCHQQAVRNNIPIREVCASPRSSEDSSSFLYPTSPQQQRFASNSSSGNLGSISQLYLNSHEVPDEQQQYQQPQDWYGFGVINSYEEDNYLQSLERRAFDLGGTKEPAESRYSIDSSSRRNSQESYHVSNRRGSLSSLVSSGALTNTDDNASHLSLSQQSTFAPKREDSMDSVQQLRTTALKNSLATNNNTSLSITSEMEEEKGYEGEDDGDEEEDDYLEEEEEEEPLPRPSVILDRGSEVDNIRYQLLHSDKSEKDGAQNDTPSAQARAFTEQQQTNANKKGWFTKGKDTVGMLGWHSTDTTQHHSQHRKALDLRPSLDNITHLARKGVPHLLSSSSNNNNTTSQDDADDDADSSDMNERNNDKHPHRPQLQQRSGFFSKWTSWARK
ncbi:hypothetical protein BDF20DRAFT_910012 [Mycotypha africana]|uniref:uncharacterized protein n=1 Tax=Mycotypha africana TaxID=64632 RepID=UPI0022FFEFDF|nr:uncharacterized protein BDF20DRAFT_910012 [Mycotypha africana]KAI8987382.1 hypothetical protein BDF20DRAFT_910012 [Mycotypha africana]